MYYSFFYFFFTETPTHVVYCCHNKHCCIIVSKYCELFYSSARSIIRLLQQEAVEAVYLTSPRNSLSSSRTLAWSHSVTSSIRSLNSRLCTGEYMNVWFHLGSRDFFTVFVLLLLLSLRRQREFIFQLIQFNSFIITLKQYNDTQFVKSFIYAFYLLLTNYFFDYFPVLVKIIGIQDFRSFSFQFIP